MKITIPLIFHASVRIKWPNACECLSTVPEYYLAYIAIAIVSIFGYKHTCSCPRETLDLQPGTNILIHKLLYFRKNSKQFIQLPWFPQAYNGTALNIRWEDIQRDNCWYFPFHSQVYSLLCSGPRWGQKSHPGSLLAGFLWIWSMGSPQATEGGKSQGGVFLLATGLPASAQHLWNQSILCSYSFGRPLWARAPVHIRFYNTVSSIFYLSSGSCFLLLPTMVCFNISFLVL